MILYLIFGFITAVAMHFYLAISDGISIANNRRVEENGPAEMLTFLLWPIVLFFAVIILIYVAIKWSRNKITNKVVEFVERNK